jgi:hypothetical protein
MSKKYKIDKRRIVHCKVADPGTFVYIGRPTKWGNPFSVEVHGRDECIKKYERYIRNKPKLLRDLKELKGKNLGCWCKPKRCHGEILLKLLKEKGVE